MINVISIPLPFTIVLACSSSRLPPSLMSFASTSRVCLIQSVRRSFDLEASKFILRYRFSINFRFSCIISLCSGRRLRCKAASFYFARFCTKRSGDLILITQSLISPVMWSRWFTKSEFFRLCDFSSTCFIFNQRVLWYCYYWLFTVIGCKW